MNFYYKLFSLIRTAIIILAKDRLYRDNWADIEKRSEYSRILDQSDAGHARADGNQIAWQLAGN